MISLFVLVLATCCYSLPVQDQFQSSTPVQEFSTGVTIVEHPVKVNMRLISPEESNDIPSYHSEHKYGEHDSEHMPTDEVSRPTRLTEEMSSKFTTQSPLSHHERSLNEFTTIESKTDFEERSVNSFPGQEHSLELTTIVEPLASTSFDFHPRELTTSVESLPREFSTSADSFGKFTGLLNNDETTEESRFEQTTEEMKVEQSTAAKQDDSSIEETTEKPQHLVKTISVIPGKITETQIFGNEASKAYFMRQPEQQQQQLTQGQKQSIVKTQKSNY